MKYEFRSSCTFLVSSENVNGFSRKTVPGGRKPSERIPLSAYLM